MKKKKASLNISVQAIIILIFAITILGLGLGFIKGMFGKVSGTFDEMISNEPDPAAASSSNPITLSRETLVVDPGEEVALKVGFYHTGAAGSGGNYDCPDITIHTGSTSTYNTQRQDICEGVGCTFTDGGDNAVTGDTCTAESGTGDYTATPEIDCGAGVINTASDSNQASEKSVNIRDRVVLTLIFPINNDATPGTKLCSIKVGSVEQDIMIRVKG